VTELEPFGLEQQIAASGRSVDSQKPFGQALKECATFARF